MCRHWSKDTPVRTLGPSNVTSFLQHTNTRLSQVTRTIHPTAGSRFFTGRGIFGPRHAAWGTSACGIASLRILYLFLRDNHRLPGRGITAYPQYGWKPASKTAAYRLGIFQNPDPRPLGVCVHGMCNNFSLSLGGNWNVYGQHSAGSNLWLQSQYTSPTARNSSPWSVQEGCCNHCLEESERFSSVALHSDTQAEFTKSGEQCR